jgi:hypothetical protein
LHKNQALFATRRVKRVVAVGRIQKLDDALKEPKVKEKEITKKPPAS